MWDHPYIQSVRPLAVEAGEAVTIAVKGFNLTPPNTRYDVFHSCRDRSSLPCLTRCLKITDAVRAAGVPSLEL